MPVYSEFQSEGDAGQAFNQGQNAGMSMMERAQQMEQRGAQEERQKAIFQAGLPLLQAKNQADLAEAHDKMAQFIDLQDQRQQMLPVLSQARKQFHDNQLIADPIASAKANTQWVGQYSQLANLPEYKAEFDNYNHLATQASERLDKIAFLKAHNDAAANKLVPPIVRLAQSYQDALANNPTIAPFLKESLDKQVGVSMPPSAQSEFQKLAHQLEDPNDSVPKELISARMNDLIAQSGQTISLPNPAAAGAPTTIPGNPSVASPAPTPGATPIASNPVQPVSVTTGTPKPNKAQDKLFDDISTQREALNQNQFYLSKMGEDIKAEQDSTLGSGPVVGSSVVAEFRPTARQVREDIGDFANRIMSTVKNIRNVREFNAVTAAIPKASDPAEVQNNKLAKLSVLNQVMTNRNDEMEKQLRADPSLSKDKADQIAVIKFPFPGLEAPDQSTPAPGATEAPAGAWTPDKEARYQELLKKQAGK